MNFELIVLALFLVIMLLLINNNYHYSLVFGMGVLVILLLNRILNRENFQVNMDTILSATKDPLELEQQKQELMISNLEDKLKFYKAALQEEVQEVNNDAVTKITIENSCGPFDQTDNISDYAPNSDDMTIMNSFFVNRGQIAEI
jgi:hypothetical protein